MKIKLPKELVELCQKFAQEAYKARQNRNRRRNDNNPGARIRNEAMGKAGEFAAWMAGFGTELPDLAIYTDGSRNYSFGGDLGKFHHVKTCSRYIYKYDGSKYEVRPSWLIEWRDPVVKSPEDQDRLCFVQADWETMEFEVLGYHAAKGLSEFFQPPVRADLAKNKVAVYHSDMKDALQEGEEKCQRTLTGAQIAELRTQLNTSVEKPQES